MNGEATAAQNPSLNPYVGPRAFREDQQEFFFGRDGEIAILEGLVLARPTVLLYSQSGAGKSSLLRAGLIPSLTRQHKVGKGERERLYQKMRVLPVATVGGAVPSGVNAADVGNMYTYSVLLSLQTPVNSLSLAQMTLAQGLEPLLASAATDRTNALDVLLIVDQFEELFTRHVDRWQDRERFFQQLGAALRDHQGLRVLLSMREDYIAELTSYAGLLPDQLSSRFRLERLRPSAALDAVRKPAERAGRIFPEDAARWLVRNLCRVQSTASLPSPVSAEPFSHDEEAGCFVEPVHLQVVCRQLWTSVASARQIRLEDVRIYGDVHEALTKFYQDAVREAAARIGGREMLVRYWFEKEVITPARTRNLVYWDPQVSAAGSLPQDAVRYLDEAHIVRPMVRDKDTWYELAHDRLIEPVLQANQAWWLLQPRLVQVAKAWDDAGRGSLPAIDASLEAQIRQGVVFESDPPVKEFIEMARAGTADEGKQDRLLERDLSEKGWGVIFAATADPALPAALSQLLAHRRERAKTRYRLFSGEENGYRPGETASQFLDRHETGAGSAAADSMPYYLLIVGSPVDIPFEFQYYLGVNHAVGRIALDTWQEYADYARSVVAAETGQVFLPRRAVLFATNHPDDVATKRSHDRLVTPLVQELQAAAQDWNVTLMAEQGAGEEIGDLRPDKGANKEDLRYLLESGPAWSLLFTAADGVQLEKGDDRQLEDNGAILCQAWPGRVKWPKTEPISPDYFFAASDLASLSQAQILGAVAFMFGPFSAGTPRLDNYAARGNALYGPQGSQPQELAPEPFVARLPQRLLGHPAGGALAVIGHVDVNWSTSFVGRSRRGQSSIGAFAFALSHLMNGYPVGFAMEEFRRRFRRELSGWADMQMQLNMGQSGQQVDPTAHATQETAMIDLRNFVILGDPAVRLAVAEPGKATAVRQPVLTSVTGVPELKLHPAAVRSVVWRPDGQYLLSTCDDGAARIWPGGVGEPWTILADPGDEIQAAAWRDDGLRVATLSRQGVLALWDVSALPGEGVGPPVRVGDRVDLMVWQPNGTALAVVRGRDLDLCDGDSGASLHTLTGHTGLIRSCSWSPDGKRIATTCRDAVLRIWDAQTGELLEARSVPEKLGLASWRPDGRFLAYSAELLPEPVSTPGAKATAITPLIRILDAVSFAQVHELRGHLGTVRLLAWRPSGDLLASISGDKAIVWDVSRGEQRFAVERSALPIDDTAYSPDGRMLWSTGDDQIVRLWRAESGKGFQTIGGHGGKVTAVAWQPDSASVTIARDDGLALLVEVDEAAYAPPAKEF